MSQKISVMDHRGKGLAGGRAVVLCCVIYVNKVGLL